MNKVRCQVQGHRGSRGTFPENTLPGFLEAIDAKASGVEFDLQITKDGKVVIFHDFFITPERLQNLKGGVVPKKLVRDCLLEELRCLTYSPLKEFPEQKGFSEAHILSLEELFSLLVDRRADLKLNLEIKSDYQHVDWSVPSEIFVDKVVSIVEHFGFQNRVYYSSFDPKVLIEVRKRALDAQVSYIVDKEHFPSLYAGNSIIQMGKYLKATSLAIEYNALNSTIVEHLKREGFKVIPWTLNDPEQWKAFIEMGIDEIITDFPRKLIHFLNEK